jgi:hypothetical protein
VVHPACLTQLLEGSELEAGLPAAGLLVLSATGPGFTGAEGELTAYLFDGAGAEVVAERLGDPAGSSWETLLLGAGGRGELGREVLCITLESGLAEEFRSGDGRARFAVLRRQALREVIGQGQ